MTQEEKSKVYSALLFEHDKISNQINSIKGESLEMNQEQMGRINKLQSRQQIIVNQMRSLMM
jgi:hypothetical protein